MWQLPWQSSTGSPLPYLSIAVFQTVNPFPLSWFSLDIESLSRMLPPVLLPFDELKFSFQDFNLMLLPGRSLIPSWVCAILWAQITPCFFVLITLYYKYALICLLPGFCFYFCIPYLPQRGYIGDAMKCVVHWINVQVNIKFHKVILIFRKV